MWKEFCTSHTTQNFLKRIFLSAYIRGWYFFWRTHSCFHAYIYVFNFLLCIAEFLIFNSFDFETRKNPHAQPTLLPFLYPDLLRLQIVGKKLWILTEKETVFHALKPSELDIMVIQLIYLYMQNHFYRYR